MKVVVTGGAGFIGSHVADACIARGDEVLIVDDLSSGRRENVPSGARLVEVDIRDGLTLQKAFASFGPEAICHHAAQASVSVSVREPVLDASINVEGSIRLLELARQHEARMIFASTGGALYGEVPEGVCADVATPASPLSPYACSKAAFEFYLRAYGDAYDLPYTILRYGNVYGPRQDPHGEAGVVAIFARRLLEGLPIQINARAEQGDEGCVRDYVFVEDVVKANLVALKGELDGQTLNVGTGQGTSTRTLAQQLIEALEIDAEVKDGAYRKGDLERSVLDVEPMRALLGTPCALADGLKRTAYWFAQHHKEGV